MDEMGSHLQGAGKKIGKKFNIGWAAGLGTLGIGAILGLTRVASEAIQKLSDETREAAKLGVTLEDYQKLATLSDLSGESAKKFADALKEGGTNAAYIRTQMEEMAKTQNDIVSREQKNAIGGWLTDFWNSLKGTAMGVHQGIVQSLMNGPAAGIEAASDYFAKGETARGTEETNAKVAAGLAHIVNKDAENKAAKEKAERDAANASASNRNRARVTGDPFAYMRPGAMNADSLSQVGIGHSRQGQELKQYQAQSITYLRRIALNTDTLLTGAETIIPSA